jgi:hypothetical protein
MNLEVTILLRFSCRDLLRLVVIVWDTSYLLGHKKLFLESSDPAALMCWKHPQLLGREPDVHISSHDRR